MLHNPYSFDVEVLRDGAVLGSAVASVAACVEDVCFRAVLAGDVPNDGELPPLALAPVWHTSGPPVVAAVRVRRDGAHAALYGRAVFAPRARAVMEELVRQKLVAEGDQLTWRVVAAAGASPPPPRFRARATRAPYPLRPGTIPGAAPGTLAVVIEAGVLDAVRAAVLAAGAVECAGLLVGQVVHDRQRGAAAVLVSGQVAVPAGQGGASGAHFAFGAESFAAARRALAEGPLACVGWYHSHPPCARCPENPGCAADFVFFSAADVQVHATAFPAGYMVALVAGKVRARPATDAGFRLYCWSEGAIGEVPLAPGGRRPGDAASTAAMEVPA